jgi:predicted N-acyltransferase
MLTVRKYFSVKDIPVSEWNRFVVRDAVGLEIAHLSAIEHSKINNLKPIYFLAYQDDLPIGIAYGIILNVDFAKLSNRYGSDILNTIRCWKPDFMKVKILEMGHIASLGSTVEFLPEYSSDFLRILSSEIDDIVKNENLDLCLIRDIPFSKWEQFRNICDYGYCSSLGYPIAKLDLKWSDISGYYKDLKSKKRNQIVQRRSRLQKEEISVEVIEDYAPYAERLTELWTQVAQHNNGYEHERLTPDFFRTLSSELKGRSHLVAIKRYDELIAFGLNLIGYSEYFGMAEGLDYRYRDTYDLYFNNIFESLKVACELKMKKFNVGITTYDFKTSMGCE